MTINSVMNAGVQGMLQSQREITKSATEIVQVATSGPESVTTQELVEPLINMKIEQNVFDASAKVVSVADETLGVLLDIKV